MGDDAAGLHIVRELSNDLQSLSTNHLIIETGPAPENFTGQIRRFGPDVVLLIDAAQMGLAPGSIRLLSAHEAVGWGGSTHTLPLSTLSKFIAFEIGCEVYILGIQVKSIEPGSAMSEEVQEAVDSVINGLNASLLSRT